MADTLKQRADRIAKLRAKVTPGPWFIWKGHTDVFAGRPKINTAGLLENHDGRICEIEPEDLYGIGSEARQIKQARANTRFIAAAHVMADLIADQQAEIERLRKLIKCPCNEPTCVEPWEPGCGLGNSEEHAAVSPESIDHELGAWLSAALEDPGSCESFKSVVRRWFELRESDNG